MATPYTRTQLGAQLTSSGFDYLTTARVDEHLDRAADEVILGEPWPARRRTTATTTDSVGLIPAVSRLGQVVQVRYDSLPLVPVRHEAIFDAGLGPATGLPTHYYLASPTQLGVWPVPPAGTALDVVDLHRMSWQTPAGVLHAGAAVVGTDVLLGNGGDFDEAVLLAARLRALEETDEVELREAVAVRLERELVRLRDGLLLAQVDEPTYIKQTRTWE